jgi:hypothetical protein
MDTPKYCIVGIRPVKALLENDGFSIYVFNWSNGHFDLDLSYIEKIYFGTMDDVEELSKEEFDKYVLKLKKRKRF